MIKFYEGFIAGASVSRRRDEGAGFGEVAWSRATVAAVGAGCSEGSATSTTLAFGERRSEDAGLWEAAAAGASVGAVGAGSGKDSAMTTALAFGERPTLRRDWVVAFGASTSP